jgi:transcriptional regulator with XRE-family HTH domain
MEKTGEELKDKVVRLRNERNWSQEVLANKAQLSTQAIKHIEKGRRGSNMTIDTAKKLAGSFGMTISEFIGEKELSEKEKEVVKELPVSHTLKKMMCIPDEVYELASQLDGLSKKDKDELWEDIIETLDVAVKQKQVRGV